mgnify:CR=1 FL=1
MLENKSDFKTENINAALFTAIDKSIHGLFQANIPDQQIEGSISFSQKDGLKIRSNLSIDMSKIMPKNQYLSLSGEENFKIVMTVKKNQTSTSESIIGKIGDSINEKYLLKQKLLRYIYNFS